MKMRLQTFTFFCLKTSKS